jgi:hypothetical protein
MGLLRARTGLLAFALLLVACRSGSSPGEAPSPLPLPRAAISAQALAVVIAQGDPLSEAIGRAYQRARGIPEAHMLRVAMPTHADVIDAAAFAPLKAHIDALLPGTVQAMLLTFTRPSRVQGPCTASITSALAMGYSPELCGGCAATRATPYHDSDSTRPFQDFRIRPTMMLGATTLEQAEALIARGVAADGSRPRGSGWLVRTSDGARSVRHPDWLRLPSDWADLPHDAPGLDGVEDGHGLALNYVDASRDPAAQLVRQQSGLLFYFTGLERVADIATNQWLPGAVADHLTSAGGVLPDGASQMPATEWLAAGATASYGTVEEPCNHLSKFPKVSVLLDHYFRGATLIEAYWKSVASPGQGLFLGEPLARPWPDQPFSRIEGETLLLRSRAWRRDSTYRVEGRADAHGAWQTLGTLATGRPRPLTWRISLPPGTAQLRLIGPCADSPMLSCELSAGDLGAATQPASR